MLFIEKKDRDEFGENIKGVGNNYNDCPEIESFERFLKSFCISKYKKYEYEVVPKPFGERGIDLVVRLNNVNQFYVDVEVWKKWEDDWPENYKNINFLERKRHFIDKYGDKFMMMYSNMNHNKFIMIKSKDIIKYPVVDVFISKINKYDKMRRLNFEDGILFGSGFGELEKEKFTNIKEIFF